MVNIWHCVCVSVCKSVFYYITLGLFQLPSYLPKSSAMNSDLLQQLQIVFSLFLNIESGLALFTLFLLYMIGMFHTLSSIIRFILGVGE